MTGDCGDPTAADCREAVERLYHFLDGALDDNRVSAIKRHLDDCAPCVEAFRFEEQLRVVISHKCREHVPEALRARIVAAIRNDEGPVEDL